MARLSQLPRRKPPSVDFPMTPLIDMVFLLLVFFMTVSTMVDAQRRREVSLPVSTESEVPRDAADRITLTLDADGRVFAGPRALAVGELGPVLGPLLAERPGLRINLRVDRETPYSHVAEVLRECARVGARDIIYATRQAGVAGG